MFIMIVGKHDTLPIMAPLHNESLKLALVEDLNGVGNVDYDAIMK